ncbi:hypothetical protein B0H11DRAFT_1333614 [Mycena galericulata]|nr:hypothetical protein B0H11DRAFT_1333614 [Mycena galericulata]
MLVDSAMSQPSLFAPPYADYSQDMSDFFHTELFSALPSASSPSSSGHSQSSGSRESTPHVLTPPQAAPVASFPDIDVHSTGAGSPTPSFFNFLDEDVKALDPLAMLSSAPYDFFGAFASSGGGGGGGGGGVLDPNNSVNMGMEMMGIDPQLVGSPAPMTFSDFDSPESSTTSPSSSSSSGSQSQAAQSPPEQEIAPVKVGGHGKARKGTVAGGGIAKKAAASSSASATAAASGSASSTFKENNHASNAFMPSTTFKPRAQSKGGKNEDDEDDEDDLPADWRPPPEVFQKMSSKEKRQLRNKISARNFRVRRKEYISTLEDNIAERDRLLSAIRSELGSTQSENLALRQEIAALKRSLLDGRGRGERQPVLPPPGPLPSSLSSSSSPTLTSGLASPTPSGRASPLPLINKDKDLSASASSSTRFWGGALGGMGMGGYTSVHTARIPELLGASPFASSPFAPAAGEQSQSAHAPHQQENLNPALNGGRVAEVLRAGMGMGAGTGAPNANATGNGEAFGDATPFTVRSLDAYRMHLWGRMAAQYRYNKEQTSSSPSSNSPSSGNNSNTPSAFSHPSAFSSAHAAGKAPLTGLAGGLRPKYFASPTLGAFSSASSTAGSYSASSSSGNGGGSSSANSLAASLAGLSLSGKHAPVRGASFGAGNNNASANTNAPSSSGGNAAGASPSQREREQAMYAALASQTLLKRLGGAFWDAFSGSEPRSSSSPSSSASASASSSSLPGGGGGLKWDPEKVRKVLEGTAVVRVVDVEPPAAVVPRTPVLVGEKPKTTPVVGGKCEKKRGKCGASMHDCLEEGMRSLSLKK